MIEYAYVHKQLHTCLAPTAGGGNSRQRYVHVGEDALSKLIAIAID